MGNERKGGKHERKQGWAGPVLFIVWGKRRGRAFPRSREGTPNFARVFILPPPPHGADSQSFAFSGTSLKIYQTHRPFSGFDGKNKIKSTSRPVRLDEDNVSQPPTKDGFKKT